MTLSLLARRGALQSNQTPPAVQPAQNVAAATGTGAGHNALVSSATTVTVVAATAVGTASGAGPSTNVRVASAQVAVGTGSGISIARPSVGVSPVTGTAAGVGHNPAPTSTGNPLNFTGSPDGSLPSPWVFNAGGAGASASVLAGRLRLVSGNVGGPSSFHGSRTTYGATTYTDFDALARLAFANPKVEQYCQIIFRMSGYSAVNDFPQNGYGFSVRPHNNSLYLIRGQNGGYSELTSVTRIYTPGTDVWLRVQARGSVLRGRVWDVGTTEPATWAIEYTDTTHPSGKWGVSTAAGPSNVACSWDDFDLSGPPVNAPATLTTAVGVANNAAVQTSGGVRAVNAGSAAATGTGNNATGSASSGSGPPGQGVGALVWAADTTAWGADSVQWV